MCDYKGRFQIIYKIEFANSTAGLRGNLRVAADIRKPASTNFTISVDDLIEIYAIGDVIIGCEVEIL